MTPYEASLYSCVGHVLQNRFILLDATKVTDTSEVKEHYCILYNAPDVHDKKYYEEHRFFRCSMLQQSGEIVVTYLTEKIE